MNDDLLRQIDLLLDDELSDADTATLYRRAAEDPAVADALTLATMLHTQVGEQLKSEAGDQIAKVDGSPPSLTPRRNVGSTTSFRLGPVSYGVAAALVLTGAAVAIYLLSAGPSPTRVDPPSQPDVATIVESTGTLWVNGDVAIEGSDYTSGTYSTDSGSAQFLLRNRVTVDLQKHTQLVVHNPMHATLTSGSASFICPEGSEGFTVDLPRGVRVVDLGTAFTIAVLDNGPGRVRVTEGRVRIDRRADDGAVLESRVLSEHRVADVDPDRIRVYSFHLSNGGFETDAADSNGSFPLPWYSGHPDDWQEFRHRGLSGNTGTAVAFGFDTGGFRQTGYIYQNVGTYSGESTITLSGTAYHRTAFNGVVPSQRVFGDVEVAFYYTRGDTFVPGEGGPDPAVSGTLIGVAREFEEGVNLPGLVSGPNATRSRFTHTVPFTGSGIAVGDKVWMRVGDGDNIFGGQTTPQLDEPYLDDLAVSSEPAASESNTSSDAPPIGSSGD